MPGVHLLGDAADDSTEYPSIPDSLDALRHDERYESAVLVDDPHVLASTAYPEYPIQTFESEGLWVCLEGELYDVPDARLADECLMAGEWLHEPIDAERIRDWLLGVDGEFVLYALDTTSGELAVCNDALGRLPLYYHVTGTRLVSSRELRFVHRIADVDFDRMGIAQSLLFGFPLGDRTLLEDVTRLPPATVLTLGESDVETTTLHQFDFERNDHGDRSVQRNASELASRFSTACRNRANVQKRNLVSLSGGLDSRAVLAGLRGVDAPVAAATMDYPPMYSRTEVEIAERIAATLDVEWRSYRLQRPTGADLDALVKTMNGMNSLSMAHILRFFEEIRREYGSSTTYFTGDGGDKVLHDLSPANHVADDADLVEYCIDYEGRTALGTVAGLTGIPADRIVEEIRSLVATYPERSPARKYVHFLVYERAVNLLGQGEDRNRFHFWGTTPFYSLPVFVYAMNCPDGQKRDYRLYREFLERLSPASVRIDNVNFGVPPASRMHTVASVAYRTLQRSPTLSERAFPILKGVVGDASEDGHDEPLAFCLEKQHETNDEIERFLPNVDDVLANVDEEDALYDLFTVTSFIDDVTQSPSVLEQFEGRTFV